MRMRRYHIRMLRGRRIGWCSYSGSSGAEYTELPETILVVARAVRISDTGNLPRFFWSIFQFHKSRRNRRNLQMSGLREGIQVVWDARR